MASKPKKPILPREGVFTTDSLIVLLKKTLFNPTLTLPAFLLLQYTSKGQDLLPRHLGDKKAARWLKTLRVLATLGVLGRINRFLNWGAANNWSRATFKPDDEIVLVTGGSQGIGAAIAQEFAAKGVKVVVLDIQPLSYPAAPNMYYFKVDLSSASDITAVAKAVRIQVGNPTVVINNAGICRGRTILASTERDNAQTFAVNALSHYQLAREFVADMVRRDHGHVVTVASAAAYMSAAPQMVDYAASKAAAVAFHEGLAAELKHRYAAPSVRASLVTQGYVRTPLFAGFTSSLRPLEPETLAEAIVDQVLRARGGHIVLPRLLNGVAGVRGWSHWLQTLLRDSTRESMANFNGKQVMAEI